MTQPFEDNQLQFLVLVNDEGQHSLWPGFAEVPTGWKTCFGPETRQSCLEYVEREWVDMRPLSLIKAMEQSAQ
ncbi:MAG TPA: MbtH family protein [Dyella sp.]|uniref:MbtH family protein n=1 Tax=Dyella sp. TaxID=1869338 RepID=UPI002BC1079B|nr:MbtH family protein [Dyella sp.]HUB91223.1 MbtH family protein [Dyella sp.]